MMHGILRHARLSGPVAAAVVVAGSSINKSNQGGYRNKFFSPQKDIQISSTCVDTCNCEAHERTSENIVTDNLGVNNSGESTDSNIPSSRAGTKLLFLGTGSSTGCPKPICALTFPQQLSSKRNSAIKLQEQIAEKCKISALANIGDPRRNRNYRNNPSLLISHRNNDDECHEWKGSKANTQQELRNVVIDVGKTFREGALRWMPHHGIYHIDSVVLTHEHADAFLGLDDLRGFQVSSYIPTSNSSVATGSALPIYLSESCFETVKKAFGYLVPKKKLELEENNKNNSNIGVVKRHVASLDFQLIHHFQPFHAAGLKMIPLPVKHGEDFICNGYAFSVKGDNGYRGKKDVHVVYLSDISRMIPETEKFIMEKLPPTDILVVDTLLHGKDHSVHFSLNQALALVKRLKPKKTYLVGMNCDDFPEHEEANRIIRERDPSVEMAYDGLAIEI